MAGIVPLCELVLLWADNGKGSLLTTVGGAWGGTGESQSNSGTSHGSDLCEVTQPEETEVGG